MKVLFVVPSFHTNLYCALRSLVTRGVDVALFVWKPGRGRLAGVRVEVASREKRVSVRDAARVLRQADPDLVVIRRTTELSRPVYLAGVAQGRSLIGYDLRPLNRAVPIHSLIGRVVNGRPVHRMTPVLGLAGRGTMPDKRATYIPLPVEAAEPGAARGYAPGGVVRLLCVAKLAEARKNQRMLIGALEALAPEFAFTLTLVGSSSVAIKNADPGQLAWLRDYPRSGPIGDRVSVLEDVPFENMKEVYAAHDVCILPARKEPLGIAPLEAMGWGCVPIVSAECGSAGTVAAAEEAGLPCGVVVEPDSRPALESALRDVLGAPERLQRLGQNAQEWARRELSEALFAERFLHLAARRGVVRV